MYVLFHSHMQAATCTNTHSLTDVGYYARWYKKHNGIVDVLNRTQLCDYMFKQKVLVYDEVWSKVGRLRKQVRSLGSMQWPLQTNPWFPIFIWVLSVVVSLVSSCLFNEPFGIVCSKSTFSVILGWRDDATRFVSIPTTSELTTNGANRIRNSLKLSEPTAD